MRIFDTCFSILFYSIIKNRAAIFMKYSEQSFHLLNYHLLRHMFETTKTTNQYNNVLNRFDLSNCKVIHSFSIHCHLSLAYFYLWIKTCRKHKHVLGQHSHFEYGFKPKFNSIWSQHVLLISLRCQLTYVTSLFYEAKLFFGFFYVHCFCIKVSFWSLRIQFAILLFELWLCLNTILPIKKQCEIDTKTTKVDPFEAR